MSSRSDQKAGQASDEIKKIEISRPIDHRWLGGYLEENLGEGGYDIHIANNTYHINVITKTATVTKKDIFEAYDVYLKNREKSKAVKN